MDNGTAGHQAAKLFREEELCCSQAVLLAINEHISLGMDNALLTRLGSAFCGGCGAGCMCGALAGAEMALGLVLGPDDGGNADDNKRIRKIAARLHDQFKKKFGSTCCKQLTKGFFFQKKKRKKHCMQLTQVATELVLDLLHQEDGCR